MYFVRFLGLILALALTYTATTASATTFEGKVVSISDGDTFTLLTDNRQQITVRVYGVDCPESNQPFGARAKQFTSRVIFGKRVTVKVEDVDRYGRAVGIVTTREGTVLNRELLANGMAWLYTKYCKLSTCRDWKKLEQKARRSKTGLWSDSHTVAPWQFRQSQREAMPQQAYSTVYTGNTRSGKFHAPRCKYYRSRRCTARFSSRQEALNAGYTPCHLCRP